MVRALPENRKSNVGTEQGALQLGAVSRRSREMVSLIAFPTTLHLWGLLTWRWTFCG